MEARPSADGTDFEGERIGAAKYARTSWEPNGRGFFFVELPVDERRDHAEARYHTKPRRRLSITRFDGRRRSAHLGSSR